MFTLLGVFGSSDGNDDAISSDNDNSDTIDNDSIIGDGSGNKM